MSVPMPHLNKIPYTVHEIHHRHTATQLSIYIVHYVQTTQRAEHGIQSPEGQHTSIFQNHTHNTPHTLYNVDGNEANDAKTYITQFIFQTGVLSWTDSRRCRGTTAAAIGVYVWRMFHWNRGTFLMAPLFFKSTNFIFSSLLNIQTIKRTCNIHHIIQAVCCTLKNTPCLPSCCIYHYLGQVYTTTGNILFINTHSKKCGIWL